MDVEGDVLYGIDGIIGSVHDDTLTGSAPGAGNATTFAAYGHSPEAVTVLLHDGTALGGDTHGDTFEAVHSQLGSRHDDTLGRAMSTLTCWPAPTAMTDWQAKRGTTSCTATTSPAEATPAGTTASTSPPPMGLTHSPRPILSSDARIVESELN